MEIHNKYSLVHDGRDHFVIHDKTDDKIFPISKKDLHPATQIKLMKMKKFDKGGVARYEQGTPTAPVSWDDVNSSQSDTIDPASITTQASDTRPSLSQAVASAADYIAPTNSRSVAIGQLGQDAPVSVPEKIPSADTETAPAPTPTALPKASSQPQIPMVGSGMPGPGTLSNLEKQYGESVNKQTQGEIAQNHQVADAQQKALDIQQKSFDTFQGNLKAKQDQYDSVFNEVANGKIDPNHFWESKTTGQKVMSNIAILLGGISQGLTHSQTNPAMDLLNKRINEDIDAQKNNLGKKQTMLSENIRAQGNMIQGEQATRLQASAILQGQIAKIIAQTNDPIIQERGRQSIINMKHSDIPLMESLAQAQTQMQVRKMLMNQDLSNIDPAQIVPHVVPADKQKEVFTEIQKAQDAKNTKASFMDSFDQAAKDVRFATGGKPLYGTFLNPPSIKAMDMMSLPLIHDKEGRVNEYEQATVQKNHPQSFDSDETVAAKRKAMEDFFDQKSAAPTAKGYGIDLNKFNSTKTENPPPTQKFNGHDYIKVPGGWKLAKPK